MRMNFDYLTTEHKQKIFVAGICMLCVFIAFIVCDQLIPKSNNPKVRYVYGKYKEIHMNLMSKIALEPKPDSMAFSFVKKELERIPRLPGAVLCDKSASDRRSSALISETYTTARGEAEIIGYYTNVLKKNDWELIRVTDKRALWGRDPGREYLYKIDPNSKYYVNIFFPSEEFLEDVKEKYKFILHIGKDY